MKSLLKLSMLCITLALFAACEKDKETTTPANNQNNNTPQLSDRAKLLVAGKWQMTAALDSARYMGKDTVENWYADMDACEKDNFMTFGADSTCAMDEGADKCPGTKQVETLKWKLISNDTKLVFIDEYSDTLDVTALTATGLQLSETKLNTSGGNFYRVLRFKNIK